MQSFLYVIAPSSAGPVKLGISDNPNRRLKQLQTGHANRLYIYHITAVLQEQALSYEKLLHRDVGHTRIFGEWFSLTVEQAIAQVQFTFIAYAPSELPNTGTII